MIFDTHAHYDDEAFDEDRESLLTGMKEAGVESIVNIGADLASSKITLDLCRRYDFLYGAIGVHPSNAGELNEEAYQWLKKEASSQHIANGGKVVAIGEIGLDFYWDKEKEVQENQRYWFVRQMDLARELSLPIVIHSRDAAKETYDMVKKLHAEEIGGIVHCYSYSKEMAKAFLEMGFSFGIGGVLTFSSAKKLKEVVEYLPLSAIVLETDSPYLAPVPNRGKRNDSRNLSYVAGKIAEIKGIETEKVIEITKENARRTYRLS